MFPDVHGISEAFHRAWARVRCLHRVLEAKVT
jgi:hypothetical protein